jgi:pimeloyl-ACP methyl ester carboxylesterase
VFKDQGISRNLVCALQVDAAGLPFQVDHAEIGSLGEHAEWVASFLRAAGVSGSHGAADDCVATFRDWGFPLANIRQVTIWQGTEDQHVPPFHAERLRDHLPQAELRTLESESHNSIVRHLPEIINTLIATGQSAQN